MVKCFSPIAADLALLTGEKWNNGGAENYTWEIREDNAGQNVYYIQHGFGAKFLRCNVYDLDADCEVFPAINYEGIGLLSVGFAAPPAVGKKFKIVITYHGETDEEE